MLELAGSSSRGDERAVAMAVVVGSLRWCAGASCSRLMQRKRTGGAPEEAPLPWIGRRQALRESEEDLLSLDRAGGELQRRLGRRTDRGR